MSTIWYEVRLFPVLGGLLGRGTKQDRLNADGRTDRPIFYVFEGKGYRPIRHLMWFVRRFVFLDIWQCIIHLISHLRQFVDLF